LLAGFLKRVRFAEVHHHPLRSSGDQRTGRADQQLTASCARARHLSHLRGAGYSGFEELFHAIAYHKFRKFSNAHLTLSQRPRRLKPQQNIPAIPIQPSQFRIIA
jgi:hypothetical protein